MSSRKRSNGTVFLAASNRLAGFIYHLKPASRTLVMVRVESVVLVNVRENRPVVTPPLLLSEKYRYPVVSTAAPGVGFLVSPTLKRVAAALSSPPHFPKTPNERYAPEKMDEKPAKLEIPSFPVSIRARMCYD